MRRRSTYIHDAAQDVDPAEFQVKKDQFLLGAFKAAREERLTFAFDELPQEIWNAVRQCHELHIRWVSQKPYIAAVPMVARLSSGLHVQYTALKENQQSSLCPMLQKVFSDQLKCDPPNSTFTRPTLISERFASTSALQYYSYLPSLNNLVVYIQQKLCSAADLPCIHTAALLNIADTLDIDYDSISHTLTVSIFWSKPPAVSYDPLGQFTTYDAWNIDITSSNTSRAEIGILSSSPATDPHDLQLSGFLTVIGEDSTPKPTLFSFPSRHHPLPPSQIYSISFDQPTGLHRTLRITFPQQSSLTEPSTKPPDSTCALHTYLTLPSTIFPDQYTFLSASRDPSFQSTHNILSLRSLSGETDLEAPNWVVSKWGSAMLLELATPSTFPISQHSSNPHSNHESWEVTIPLHLRYIPPSSTGNSNISVPWPIVFWACTAEEGTLFPTNPFDKTNLGYDGLFGPRTMFYHLNPVAEVGKGLVETISVPVLDTSSLGAQWVEVGTVVCVVLGFAWVVWRLWPGLRDVLSELLGSGIEARGGKQVEKKTQ